MKLRKLILLPILVPLIVQALNAEGLDDFSPDRKVVYKKVGDTELMLHIFNPPGHQAGDKTPAIVFFFGGGWKGGSPKQFYPHCDYLASRGMVAISAEYRVRERNNTTPEACVRDGKSAIRWIRQHADELGIDPNQLAAGGGSAGGQVAAAAGTLSGYDEPDEDLSISSRPDALVLFNPVIDNGPSGYGYERVSAYWRDFSPIHNISASTPPAIIFQGMEDNLIPVGTARYFQFKMESFGIRCDLHLYPGQPHGFFNYRFTDIYLDTLVKMDRFLASLGYLKGEPTVQEAAGR